VALDTFVVMTNTPKPKTTAARKSSPTPKKAAAKATPKPAAKSTKKAAKPAAAPVAKAEPKRALAADDVAHLVELHNRLTEATEIFEICVVGLLMSGESPTHIAKALDIAGSSVRRIGFRNGFGEAPADKRRA
jgi:hypothetical protein